MMKSGFVIVNKNGCRDVHRVYLAYYVYLFLCQFTVYFMQVFGQLPQ